jgi:hypothetical protein
MKATGPAVIVAIFGIMSAAAFVGDVKSIGDLGPELEKAIATVGQILTDVARPSADDLVENKIQTNKRLTDLRDETEAISQLLRKMEDGSPLSIAALDPKKRAEFLLIVPPDQRSDIESTKAIGMSTVSKIYSDIRESVKRDALFFEAALSESGRPAKVEDINKVATARGALIASLGRLVEFSGRILELYSVQKKP